MTTLFAVTLFHGLLAAALIGSLCWALFALSRASAPAVLSRAIAPVVIGLALAVLTNLTGTYSYIVSCYLPPARTAAVLLIEAPWTHRVLLDGMAFGGLLLPFPIVGALIAVVGSAGPQTGQASARKGATILLYVALSIVLLLSIAGFVPSLIDFAR